MLAVYIKCHLRYWVSKNDPCSGEAFMEDRVQLIMTVKTGNGTKCKLNCHVIQEMDIPHKPYVPLWNMSVTNNLNHL